VIQPSNWSVIKTSKNANTPAAKRLTQKGLFVMNLNILLGDQ
jgi:hypothetical protein